MRASSQAQARPGLGLPGSRLRLRLRLGSSLAERRRLLPLLATTCSVAADSSGHNFPLCRHASAAESATLHYLAALVFMCHPWVNIQLAVPAALCFVLQQVFFRLVYRMLDQRRTCSCFCLGKQHRTKPFTTCNVVHLPYTVHSVRNRSVIRPSMMKQTCRVQLTSGSRTGRQ